jgi:thioredoxin 1
MVYEFTDQSFETEVIKNEKAVLVDFWAPWCGPCMIMGPIVEELAGELGDKIKIGKINVDENKGTAEKYEIMSIPSLKVFKGGKIVKEFIGVQQKESLKAELNKIV